MSKNYVAALALAAGTAFSGAAMADCTSNCTPGNGGTTVTNANNISLTQGGVTGTVTGTFNNNPTYSLTNAPVVTANGGNLNLGSGNLNPTATSTSTSSANNNLTLGNMGNSNVQLGNMGNSTVRLGNVGSTSAATVGDISTGSQIQTVNTAGTVGNVAGGTVKDSANVTGSGNSTIQSGAVQNNITFKAAKNFVQPQGLPGAVGCSVASGAWIPSASLTIDAGKVVALSASVTRTPDAEKFKDVAGCKEHQLEMAYVQGGVQPGANKVVALLAATTVADKLGEDSAFATTLNALKDGDKGTLAAADLFAPEKPTFSNTTYVQAPAAPAAAAVAMAPVPQETTYVITELPRHIYNSVAKGNPVATPKPLAQVPCDQWVVGYACTAGASKGRVFTFTETVKPAAAASAPAPK